MPNATSIFWACAQMENAATAAQTKVKKIAFRKVCFKAKPPCPVMVLTAWMQLKCTALPDVARFTRIYGYRQSVHRTIGRNGHPLQPLSY
jgi:hypothetical protein